MYENYERYEQVTEDFLKPESNVLFGTTISS